MEIGSLVKIPNWQARQHAWLEFRNRGIGIVLDVTPYAVHVRWSNGEEMAHKTEVAELFEVVV